MPTGQGLLNWARAHVGEHYENVLVPKNNAAWNGPWDCAEFVSWVVYQEAHILYGCLDDHAAPALADAYTGSWKVDSSRLGIRVSVEEAASTIGGIVLRFPPSPGRMGHIAICDGQGGTIEAKGKAYGVVEDTVQGRPWDAGILIPGIKYAPPTQLLVWHAPKHLYALNAPNMNPLVVAALQRAVADQGFDPGPVDGVYGPNTSAAVAAYQEVHGLVVDGQVGLTTAAALGISLQDERGLVSPTPSGPLETKTLWVVHVKDSASETRLLEHAKAAGASAVCIRTTNARLPAAIARFHAEGIKVFGWRWPACRPNTSAAHYYAPDEADYVVQQLIANGLDGYIVDPESDNDGGLNDWDDPKFAPLARQFCAQIKTAASGSADFQFGTTSGCAQPKNNRHIPWSEFVSASDCLLPQAYWRREDKDGNPQDIHGGTPASSMQRAFSAWSPISSAKPLLPIAGEIDLITAGDVADYATELQARGIRHGHFYADGAGVSGAILVAIKAL